MTEVPTDWSEFWSCLNARRVRYVVIGAHALAAAGRPRATLDLDVFVEPTKHTAKRIGDVRVNLLGEKELVANKRAAGRPKDLLDLALLAELRPKRRR